jgi:N-acetylglucosamine kinase-like BadF-type ATPase
MGTQNKGISGLILKLKPKRPRITFVSVTGDRKLSSAVGVDAGSTKTIGVLIREHGFDWSKKRVAGSGNFYDDCSTALKNVVKVVRSLIREEDNVECICLAGAGLSIHRLSDRVSRSLMNLFPGKAVVCVSDAVAAVLGATNGEAGVVLVLGTGSVCYGFDGYKFYRTGGWGWVFGDEGSAYRLGQSFLSRVLGEVDGRFEALFVNTPLFARTRPLEKLAEKILMTYNRKDKIASLAPTLIRLAQSRVPEATEILKKEALSAASLVEGIFRKTGSTSKRVHVTGGLANNRLYMAIIKDALIEKGASDVLVVKDAALKGTHVLFTAYKRGDNLRRLGAWV